MSTSLSASVFAYLQSCVTRVKLYSDKCLHSRTCTHRDGSPPHMLRSTIFGQAFSPLMHYRPVGFWQSHTQLKQLVCSLCATFHTAQENRTGANRQEIEEGGKQKSRGRSAEQGTLVFLVSMCAPQTCGKRSEKRKSDDQIESLRAKRSEKKDMLGTIFASEMRGRSDLTVCRVTTKSLSISTFAQTSNIIPLFTA